MSLPQITITVFGTAPKFELVITNHQTNTNWIKDNLDRFQIEFFVKDIVNELIGQQELDYIIDFHNLTKIDKVNGITSRSISFDKTCNNLFRSTWTNGRVKHKLKEQGPRWIVVQSLQIEIAKHFDWNEYEEPVKAEA